jgi:hypothetical protein
VQNTAMSQLQEEPGAPQDFARGNNRPRSNVGFFNEGVTGNEHSEGIKTSKAIIAHFLRTVCFRQQEVTWLRATFLLLGESNCTDGLRLDCRMLHKKRGKMNWVAVCILYM